MEKFYVSAIVQNKDDSLIWRCDVKEPCLDIERALKQIEFMRKAYRVLSAWIERFDDSGRKLVFHACYVNVLDDLF